MASLRDGRNVYECDGQNDELAGAANADVVLSLIVRRANDLLADLPMLKGLLAPRGCLVVAASGETTPLTAALDTAFPTVLRFRQRSVTGSIFAEDAFAEARVTRLIDSPGAGDFVCDVFVCASGTLPQLTSGLFEAGGTNTGLGAPDDTPAVASPYKMLPPDAGDVLTWRSRAASLAERLIDMDKLREQAAIRNAALSREIDRLQERASAPSGSWLDFPRERHGWPLLDDPTMEPEDLGLYDRRFDDDLIGVVKDGAAFFERFELDGPAPRFADAIAALNATEPRLTIVEAGEHQTPDASIIIPVYGQLAYTLNCLDALFRHRSRHSVEIIIVDDRSQDMTGILLPGVHGVIYRLQPVNRGFIASCNAGAAQARGRVLIMLNNDTRVLPDWLDNLVESFSIFPRAGVIGSKLLYPDGTLQEAGGIVWRNGEAWNYGRGDDPNRPQYCHARRVDYASGAAIAIPTAIWRELDGFDSFYAPAYYEDTDLFFRVRAAGYETWYQPTSRVVHYEGKTSGTDTGSGVKAYQVINGRKFRSRYNETLLEHRPIGAEPFLERERSVCKRVLVLEPTAPTPDRDAGSGYTIDILRILISLGYKPYFVAADNFLFQPGYTTALQRMGIECAYAPYDLGFEAYVSRYGSLFDLVLVFRVQLLEPLYKLLRTYIPHAPLLFNNHDLHYLRMQRGAELSGDPDRLADAAEMKIREITAMSQVDCIISPSPFEVDILARELPNVPAVALPLMADLVGTTVGFAKRRNICFLGGYAHAPNVDAVAFFVTEVMPLILAEQSDIRFIIAGANPTAEVRALESEHVIVTGMVPDLRDVFDAARVFVCPLRFGAGMKGKNLTAMSYGVPIVSTTIGIEGIAARPGEQVLVADSPADLAAACLKLYRGRKMWERMSRSGMDLIRERYSRESGAEAMRQAIELGFAQMLRVDGSATDIRQAEAAE